MSMARRSKAIALAGTYTALVTPFKRGGAVDFERLRSLVDMQVAAGVAGLSPVGTTGESPTLDFDEHDMVIAETVRAAAGRVMVIAGTGANATSEALQLTRHAKDAGADATLQVVPYYNRPSQEGLRRHFEAVADVGLPVVLYNVPSRTARELAIDTIVKLAAHPNIIAVKEAGGSVDRVSEILRRCRLTVLSGDDPLTFPMMAVGAKGVISVAANIIPRQVAQMTRLALEGHWEKARRLHLKYLPLFKAMFMETNPVPIKAAMAMAGLIEEVYRLPLCKMSGELKARLRRCLRQSGVL